jgi:hypothetical protein
MKRKQVTESETFIPMSEVPAEGPALIFDAEGDIAEALVQALLEEAHCLSRQPASMVFVLEGSSSCRLVFTEPAPMPLVKSLIHQLHGGTLRSARLEKLHLRPLLRIDASGFSLFVRPVLPEVTA